MAKTRFDNTIVTNDVKLKRKPNGTAVASGVYVPRVAVAVFDTAGNDSGGTSNKTIATHGLGVYIPKNALVTRAWYRVVTTFADGASNNATLALQASAANDLVSAIAISDTSTPWTAGNHGTLAGNPAEATVAGDTGVLSAARMAATYIGPMTAEKELKVVVGTHALTAGKLILYVEFVQAA
jgi:hypothetical protein